jgi:2-oxoglutarate ferredoxin oxidoreductase subunit gamma
MKTEITISGFGGQGIMFAGTLLAHAAMNEGKFVTFFPSYGAEMRGGTANCQIIISSKPIGSPIVYNPDVLLSFNKPSFGKFSLKVKRGGAIFANTSLCEPADMDNVDILGIPANTMAEECGSILAMNLIILGAFIKKSGIIKLESLVDSINELLIGRKEKHRALNIRASEKGYNFI